MLKYLYSHEIFAEVPSEITLGISISGCQIRCKDCHSRELWEDKGTPLDIPTLNMLLNKHSGITCLLLLGGEREIGTLTDLFKHVKTKGIKTAWYCGLDLVPKEHQEIYQYLDYIKLGHYNPEFGGLDNPNTNQKFYLIEHNGDGSYYETDLTYKFQKQLT